MCDLCTPNLCDDCQKPVLFEFQVSPHLWHIVAECQEPINAIDGGEGYLCLSCFVTRLIKQGGLQGISFEATIYPNEEV